MKKTLNFLTWMLVMLFAVPFVSCSDDDDDADVDLADIVAGTYVGTLQNIYSTNDAYVVTITRVSATAVTIEAAFLTDSDGGVAVFNVSQYGTQYILTNSYYDTRISVIIVGSTLNISFSNQAGSMTTFIGSK